MKPIYIDIALLILLILSIYRGWKKGFLHLLFKFLGFFGGVFAGIIVAKHFASADKPSAHSVFILLAAIAVGSTLGSLLGSMDCKILA